MKVEHSLVVSLMPSWAVREEIETGKLALVRIEKSELMRSRGDGLKGDNSAPIRAFIEYVLDKKAELQIRALDETAFDSSK